jgi:hypothetical protein
VGVVKQQPVPAGVKAVRANPAHQLWFVPLVNEYQVRAVEGCIQIQVVAIKENALQGREGGVKIMNGALAVLRHKVLQAPSASRLVDLDLVVSGEKLGYHPPQEMGISVIPIRYE